MYLEIKGNIHFNDNSKVPESRAVKCFKIAPLYEMLNSNFIKFGAFSQKLSVEEQMVRYYGHRFLKQFIKGKPIRFGFIQWAPVSYTHLDVYKRQQGGYLEAFHCFIFRYFRIVIEMNVAFDFNIPLS